MKHILIPLQGPAGVRPKAPAVGAWQSPSYKGIHEVHEGDWVGLRCDDIVVIDCDNLEAAKRWREIDTAEDTCVRKTPRGFHFVYQKAEGSPDAPAADIFGAGSHIDLRAGRSSQVVYYAPGYRWIQGDLHTLTPFRNVWLPENYGAQQQRSYEGESWDQIPEGRGNNTMAAFAGAFRKQGMSMYMIAKCLGAINAFAMADDPMSNTDIALIAKSVSRYAPMPDIDIEVLDE